MEQNSPTPLDQLTRAAAEYHAANERLVRAFACCVEAGYTDSAIARALGVSRQAAGKRRMGMGLEKVRKHG